MNHLAAFKTTVSTCLVGIAMLGLSFVATASESLPNVIAKVKPSVLAVGFYLETQSPRFSFRGTGFVVGDGNLLVTNAHVIERSTDVASDSKVVVYMASAGPAGVRRAEVLHLDRAHDLALLRFTGSRWLSWVFRSAVPWA